MLVAAEVVAFSVTCCGGAMSVCGLFVKFCGSCV
jgi:hypothetical protein